MFSPALQSVVFATALLGAMPGTCEIDEPGIRDGVHAQACPRSIDWCGPHNETMATTALDHSLEASP
jgi:hypothetical protein